VTDDSPVTEVTWDDAVQFCNWLSDQEKLQSCYRQDANSGWIILASGTGYRLPTEAEWEYACRAGTTTQFSFGDDPTMLDIYGWFDKNSGGRARAVGTKVANPFGLFDMHGNVYEWCQDFYADDDYSKSLPNDPAGPSSGSNRVYRGGNWKLTTVDCRSASRRNHAPASRFNSDGFRIVRVR
jgi:formylglycine-generating enzyme required for sulfatase activity